MLEDTTAGRCQHLAVDEPQLPDTNAGTTSLPPPPEAPGEPLSPGASFPRGPEAPAWLKAVVGAVAVMTVALVFLAVRSATSGAPSAPVSPVPISVVAREFCSTRSRMVQTLTSVHSMPPSEASDQIKILLTQVQGAVGDFRNESAQANLAGDATLGSDLSGMADSLQQIHDGLASRDLSTIQDAASRFGGFAQAASSDPNIANACV
jgi:hypothetical protein